MNLTSKIVRGAQHSGCCIGLDSHFCLRLKEVLTMRSRKEMVRKERLKENWAIDLPTTDHAPVEAGGSTKSAARSRMQRG